MTNNAECIEFWKSEIMDKFQFYASSPGLLCDQLNILSIGKQKIFVIL